MESDLHRPFAAHAWRRYRARRRRRSHLFPTSLT